ncbi:hypothetical protein [Yoonia sp. BS5-3]|uniref:Uncharacterized protein n=1 Tax=Yoonia phaeophyticola TaxID=3137369 RepID=A0ABZ2VA82_9RHOB
MDEPTTIYGRFLLWVYVEGHGGRVLPVWFRRMFARSQVHRAWLSGRDGNFWERGVRYGPANPYREYRAAIDAELDEFMGAELRSIEADMNRRTSWQ